MKFLQKYNRKAKARRIYRGSEHGFSANDFHTICDRKGATITIIRTSSNKIFGGFTQASWVATGGFKSDSTAFLFSVDLEQRYPVVDASQAIKCLSDCGPSFGSGADLHV